jgi:hypothetical protein
MMIFVQYYNNNKKIEIFSLNLIQYKRQCTVAILAQGIKPKGLLQIPSLYAAKLVAYAAKFVACLTMSAWNKGKGKGKGKSYDQWSWKGNPGDQWSGKGYQWSGKGYLEDQWFGKGASNPGDQWSGKGAGSGNGKTQTNTAKFWQDRAEAAMEMLTQFANTGVVSEAATRAMMSAASSAQAPLANFGLGSPDTDGQSAFGSEGGSEGKRGKGKPAKGMALLFGGSHLDRAKKMWQLLVEDDQNLLSLQQVHIDAQKAEERAIADAVALRDSDPTNSNLADLQRQAVRLHSATQRAWDAFIAGHNDEQRDARNAVESAKQAASEKTTARRAHTSGASGRHTPRNGGQTPRNGGQTPRNKGW